MVKPPIHPDAFVRGPSTRGPIPVAALVILCLLVIVFLLLHTTADVGFFFLTFQTVLTEGVMAAMVVVAAGGYGHLVLRRLAPSDAPAGLRAVTACGLGLCMLSTAVLVAGTIGRGLLSELVWWPVVLGGAVAAAWQGRRAVAAWRPRPRVGWWGLAWLALAVAAAIWWAGATRPPGFVGFTDAYDILEYHLQLPREFYNAGHITATEHNIYGFFPSGVEMLFLLAMCLRGGAYDGMYLAVLLHGAFAVLAVAGVYLAVRGDDKPRAGFAAVLLATCPFVIYLGWLGMVELAELFYLTLALLWLRRWLRGPDARSAACLGLMTGGACSVKYLSVGLAAGPVLLVMLVLGAFHPAAASAAGSTAASGSAADPAGPVASRGGRRRRRFLHFLLAGAMTLAVMSPWLVRNLIYTGNPVFPLETTLLGRGHWPAQCQQRWDAGHGPTFQPPVPVPPHYKVMPWPNRADLFFQNFLGCELFNFLLTALAVLAVFAMLAQPRGVGLWDWALLAVLAIQVAVWALVTHGLPSRFIVLAAAPMALLAGGVLTRLARLRGLRFWQMAPAAGGAKMAGGTKTANAAKAAGPAPLGWGGVAATVLLVLAALAGLVTAYGVFVETTGGLPGGPWPGQTIAQDVDPFDLAAHLPPGSRLLLVGEARGFYFPPGTIYATAFDSHPLEEMIDRGLSPAQILAELHRHGVTHIWVNWMEVVRLATTYGYPACLTPPAGLKIYRDLTALGMRIRQEVPMPDQPATAPGHPAATTPGKSATTPAGAAPGASTTEPATAGPRAPRPFITIYELPPKP